MGSNPMARSAADRFIRLHPQHPNVDYAYYLKGLAAYEKDESFFDRFVASTALRATSALRASSRISASCLLAIRQASTDARQRMIYLRNQARGSRSTLAATIFHEKRTSPL